MEPTTPQDLCNALARSNLHPPDEVRALLARFLQEQPGSRDPVAFADWLQKLGKLNDFQRGLILKGRWDRLKLGEYTLVDRLGQGRLAGIYEARHRLGQRVAVKILPPSKGKNSTEFARFQREARLARKLKHPNVVRVFQSGEANDLHFIVQEYLDGETLADVLKRRGALPPDEAVRLIHQTLQGLQHLHEQGMIHRDLNPSNLMLVGGQANSTSQATLKILEIALGRALFDEGETGVLSADLTAAGDHLGSPDYMAPEQARDAHNADIRADIYALGCVLFHALTGQVPFPDKNAVNKIVKHATAPLPRLASVQPGLPEGLQAILDWMTAKDPSQRYLTPDRAAQALQVFLMAGAVPARPLEAEAGMAAYIEYVKTQQPVVEIDVEPVAVPVTAPVPSSAVPPPLPVPVQPPHDPQERIFGLTIREWNLVAIVVGAVVVLALVLFFVLRPR